MPFGMKYIFPFFFDFWQISPIIARDNIKMVSLNKILVVTGCPLIPRIAEYIGLLGYQVMVNIQRLIRPIYL